MVRTTVGVLRGGTSSEYDASLKTGAAILAALPENIYETRDIFVDKQGMWHLRGIPTDPARALNQVDVVLSGLHGGVGEDGSVQRLLERAGVPYAGSRPLPAFQSLNKMLANQILRTAGVRVPSAMGFSLNDAMTTGDMARKVFERIGPPYVVKPFSEGASYGILVARTPVELPDVIGDTLDQFGNAIVEEFVRGQQATVGIIEDFRGEELYSLPPARIVLHDGSDRLQQHHYSPGSMHYEVPGGFTTNEKEALMHAAKKAHRALGLVHFSRADLILTPRGPYVLEVNAIPSLYEGSAFPAMLGSVGASLKDFLEHAIHLARR